eukprot:7064147-Pyramimonas_sp.AAC.1
MAGGGGGAAGPAGQRDGAGEGRAGGGVWGGDGVRARLSEELPLPPPLAALALRHHHLAPQSARGARRA